MIQNPASPYVNSNEMKKEFPINEHLVIRLDRGAVQMYVNGRVFNQCVYPVINVDKPSPTALNARIPAFGNNMKVTNSELHKTSSSVDAILWEKHRTIDHPGHHPEIKLPADTLFWGLCSTLQAWAENDYDSSLLHSNLAFPLSRALAMAGDAKAKVVFEREVVKRWKSGFLPLQMYLAQMNFLQGLSSRSLVEILAIGGPPDVMQNIARQVGSERLVDAWKSMKAREQILVATRLLDMVARLDVAHQAIMLETCVSTVAAKLLLEIMNIDRFSKEQKAMIKENKRIGKIIAIIAV